MKDKLCKYCKEKAVEVEYLGKVPESGAKLFSSTCASCGYDFIYSFNPNTKEYIRTGNLNANQNR